MAESLPWFRFYTEAIFDRKLRRMDPAHRWLWVAVLAAARQSPAPGFLLLSDGVPLTVDDLADMAALPVPSVEEGLATIVAAGLLTDDSALGALHVTSWDRRQFTSDSSTERSRASRQRAAQQRGDVAASPSETDTDTDTESSSSSVLPVGSGDAAVDEVLALVADGRLAKQKAAGTVRSPARWRAQVLKNLPAEIGTEVAHLLANFDEPPHVIAEIVEGRRSKQYLKRRPVADNEPMASGMGAGQVDTHDQAVTL